MSASELDLLRFLEDLQTNNPAEYEQMVAQLQQAQNAKTGGDESSVTVIPVAGFVVKTRSVTNGGRKAFINVCTSEMIDPCGAMDEDHPLNKDAPPPSDDECRIRIPISVGPPREDLDKNGEACTVYDVVFHPTTVATAQGDVGFRDFMLQVVLSQVQAKHKDELSADFSFPKLRDSYKGVSPLPQFIRAKPKPRPVPAAEGGGFAEEGAGAARRGPIIEELGSEASPQQRQAELERALRLLPRPAYLLRPLRADGRPLDEEAERAAPGGGGADELGAEDALGRAPAALQLLLHLPRLRPPHARASAVAALAAESISVALSAWDVRVVVGSLYALTLELPHAVSTGAQECSFDAGRCVLSLRLAVLAQPQAEQAEAESADALAASKAQAQAWEAQLAKEARARTARQQLERRRREEALEVATAAAAREADAAAAASAARADDAPSSGGEAAAGAGARHAAGEAGSAAAPERVAELELSNSVMLELE